MNTVRKHAVRHCSVQKSRCNPAVQNILISFEVLITIEHCFHAAIGKALEVQTEPVFIPGAADYAVCVRNRPDLHLLIREYTSSHISEIAIEAGEEGSNAFTGSPFDMDRVTLGS